MQFDNTTTALVLTDPQNDFLSPDGVTWELVGRNVQENGTVEHLEQLLSVQSHPDMGYLSRPTTTSRTIINGNSAGRWKRRCTRSGCSTAPGRWS